MKKKKMVREGSRYHTDDKIERKEVSEKVNAYISLDYKRRRDEMR